MPELRTIAEGLRFPEGPSPSPTAPCWSWRSAAARCPGGPGRRDLGRRGLRRWTQRRGIGPDGAVYVCNNGGFRCTTGTG
ncbi:hypothetical protein [Saccharopolyspora gregorii]|uniref:hypothetical protein n=1 Tax=Saccharopolyspora gregorii TaxID=33914 RepID=UPI0031EA75C4